jgi:hypothetical protein
MELASWLRVRAPRLKEVWWEEIQSRGLGRAPEVEGVVEGFVGQVVTLLPYMLGPHRSHIEPLWVRLSELFGAMAAKRGLAAGEVMEEFHILREHLIRELYQDPPLEGRLPLALREILRLNRTLDRAVTHASVGHTDAMFFQFFQADDREPLSEADVAEEAGHQLELIRSEFSKVCAHLSATASEPARER